MNKKFSVAIDVDCVLNNLMEKTIEMYNNLYGSNLKIDDFKEYDIFKCLPEKEAKRFVELFKVCDLWMSLTPIKNSQWGVKQLVDNGYEVYLATATHHINFAWKVDWLKSCFGMIPEENIICIHNKGLLKVNVLVDDCVDNLTSSLWYERVCLDWPWNRNVCDEAYGIHRAYNWLEIVDIINEIYDSENNVEG